MAEAAGGCCRCCCSFIFTLGLTALFMWLSLRPSKPICSIQHFYAPSLNRTLYSTNNTTNTTLYFDLKLDNKNKDKGVYYDAINLTFYYGAAVVPRSFIGNLTVPAFYQGHKKNARRRMLVQTASAVPWNDARVNGTVWFRMELRTKVRYKIMFWKTKRDSIAVGAPVQLNATDGTKMGKKGIKLKSSAPARRGYRAPVALLAILSALLIF